MRCAFFFGGGGAAPIDPTLEDLTSWLQNPAGLTPWVNLPSAGISGAQEEGHGTAPVVVTIDGVRGLNYGASGSPSGGDVRPTGGVSEIGTYLDQSGYTVVGLVYINATQAFQPTTPYQNSTILCADARWGITVSNSGLGVWHFTGTFPAMVAPMSVGAWHFFCVRYDSVSGKTQIDIDDSVVSVSQTLGPFAQFAGIQALVAKNTYTNVTSDFVIGMRATYKSRISDAKRDGWYAYLKATFPEAGLP